ncbi:MAG: hypothetical protein U1E76_24545 [Planctomycetota bacterium]
MVDLVEQLEQRILSLEGQVRRQQRWARWIALVALAMALVAFRSARTDKESFTEIDVERLNIVEPDGRLALVIANKPRLPEVILGGKEIDAGRAGKRGPGMLFFNEQADEVGGLVFGGRKQGQGYEAGALLAFDQFNNDQVVFLSYQDNGSSRRSGLHVVDRPTKPTIRDLIELRQNIARAAGEEKQKLESELAASAQRGELGAERLFVGSNDGTAMVRLCDTAGRNRIRLYVDRANQARLEFLDDQGKVVYRIPQ